MTVDEVNPYYPAAQQLLDADDYPFDAKPFLTAFQKPIPAAAGRAARTAGALLEVCSLLAPQPRYDDRERT